MSSNTLLFSKNIYIFFSFCISVDIFLAISTHVYDPCLWWYLHRPCLLFRKNSLPLSTIWYVIKLISKSIFFMETMVVILYYNMYKTIKSTGICYFNWGQFWRGRNRMTLILGEHISYTDVGLTCIRALWRQTGEPVGVIAESY